MPDIIARGMAASAAKQAALANERIGHLPNGIQYKGAVNYPEDLPSGASAGDCYTVSYSAPGVPDGREYIYGNVDGTMQWYPIGSDAPISKGSAEGSAIVGDLQHNVASGAYSIAEGSGTTAEGDHSHAEGSGSRAKGPASHAEGADTTSEWAYSHAEGSQTTAVGNCHAEGHSDERSEDYIAPTSDSVDSIVAARKGSGHAFALAREQGAHVEGSNSLALATNAHAEGNGTYALNNSAHAEGTGTIALGKYSHAEGLESEATGNSSHAEGYMTHAQAIGAHSEGRQTFAQGNFSHAGGRESEAQQDGSFTHGYQTKSKASYGVSFGYRTEVNEEAGFASGKYNVLYEEEEAPAGGYQPNTEWDYSSSELHIDNVPDFLQFINLADKETSFEGKTIYLDTDIDLNPGWSAATYLDTDLGKIIPPSPPATTWTNAGTTVSVSPRRDPAQEFAGVFDGQGHTIAGIYSYRDTVDEANHFGLLFNKVNNGELRNFSIRNSYIYLTTKANNSESAYGGLIGGLKGSGIVENVFSDATVVMAAAAGKKPSLALGGITGWNGGTTILRNCVFAGQILTANAYQGYTYPATSVTWVVGGISGEQEGGTTTNLVGMPKQIIVDVPWVGIQEANQKNNVNIPGRNLVIAGHYGSDYGTRGANVLEGAQGVAPVGSDWLYQSYLASFIPNYLATHFFNDYVTVPIFQHGDGTAVSRHDAFAVGMKALKYTNEASEYFLQVGDMQMSISQLAALFNLLKLPETITISTNEWSALLDASPYQYYASFTSPVELTPTTTVELVNNNAVLFANYGFAIGDISGQTITIYAIDQPSTDVNLGVKIYG